MKLAIDIGNRNIKIYDGKKTAIIKSMATEKGMNTKNIVELDGKKIWFGIGNSLVAQDKTARKHLKETILLSAYKMFGPKANEIELRVGLPLNRYKAQKDSFKKELMGYGNIKGKVDGEEMNITIKEVEVLAEGHAALYKIVEDITILPAALLDVGYKTTDVLLLSYDTDGELQIDSYMTVNMGLKEIYEAIAMDNLTNIGFLYKAEDIESRLKELDLKAANMVINEIYNEIESTCYDISKRHIYVIGGGSKVVYEHLDHNEKTMIDENVALYANVKGYFEN